MFFGLILFIDLNQKIMKNNLVNVDLPKFRDIFMDSDQISVGDDLCIVDIHGRNASRHFCEPFRFDGILLVWCITGNLKVSINLVDYEVRKNTLFLCMPGNMFKICEDGPLEDELHYVCLAMSRAFASDHNMDVNRMFSNALTLMQNPSVSIMDQEAALMADYLEMMVKMAKADIKYNLECIRSLWTSMLYVLAGIMERRNSEMEIPSQAVTGRSRQLFEQFLKLVSEYHDRYRNVGFYADKLCLTPKYLSKLIKNATGHSAPEWIDSYVILEAKNLLKYSDDTIKEIVYKLNFPNQSVFYKFFKARTGMTPSEYRKS